MSIVKETVLDLPKTLFKEEYSATIRESDLNIVLTTIYNEDQGAIARIPGELKPDQVVAIINCLRRTFRDGEEYGARKQTNAIRLALMLPTVESETTVSFSTRPL